MSINFYKSDVLTIKFIIDVMSINFDKSDVLSLSGRVIND
jgi:hypothetical protein